MKTSTLEDYRQRLLLVLVHIQENLDTPLALEDLARRAHFSPYHFHRIFRGMVGESVAEHIRRLRLERAAIRLKLSDTPVAAVASEAGYDSVESFSRRFKASFGEPPATYRSRTALSLQPSPSGVHFSETGQVETFEPRYEEGKHMDVVIREEEARRVAFVRHVGPYSECHEAWTKLCGQLGPQGWLGPGVTFIGLCHDDPEVTPPEQLRYDACVTVDDRFEPSGEVGVQEIRGGEYAVTTHAGPYDRLGQTYAALLGQWLPRSGRELGPPPCLEVYLNDPEATEPEDLLTDVHVALRPRREETPS